MEMDLIIPPSLTFKTSTDFDYESDTSENKSNGGIGVMYMAMDLQNVTQLMMFGIFHFRDGIHVRGYCACAFQ